MPLPYRISKNRGLIKMVILIVIALLIISYFGFNLRSIATTPTAQDNFAFVWGKVLQLWNLIKTPILWVWNEVIVRLILSKISSNVG